MENEQGTKHFKTNNEARNFDEDFKNYFDDLARPTVKHFFKTNIRELIRNYPNIFKYKLYNKGIAIKENKEKEAKQIMANCYRPSDNWVIYKTKYITKDGTEKEYLNFQMLKNTKKTVFDDLYSEDFVQIIGENKSLRKAEMGKKIFEYIKDNATRKDYKELTLRQILNFVSRRF